MKNIHTKKKSSFSKILSLLIAVVMLLTLPGFSTLADTDSTMNSTASSASSDTAETTAAAAKSNTNTALVGSSNTTVSAVADGYYRIYYSQIETVDHLASGFTDANTKWNNINSNGNVYVNVGGTQTTSGSVYQMKDTGLTLTSNGTAFEVYYYDIPVNTTTSLFFLCEDTTNATGIKTRTNEVALTWKDDKISGYTTLSSGTSTTTAVSSTSNNCFYALNPNGSDWFYQVGSNSFNPVSGITLTDTAVATGKTADIPVTITPAWITAGDLIWSTNDSSIATVAGGKVTGVADGTTTITAQYGDVTASCTVTVSSTPLITVNPNPASVKEGETITLTASITPSQYKDSTITWSSNNTSVATITDGTVTGVAAGTATITASFTVDGTTYSTTVPLTVTAASASVSGITLSPTTATIQTGKTQQLTATVTPAGT
ncbi:MAG: Ig domain-containing protein, partial [Chordicoccus sp.]